MDKKSIKFVAKILKKVDPLNLILEGAPTDEYDNEAIKIARKLFSAPSEPELKSFIKDLFSKETEIEINNNKLSKLTLLLIDGFDHTKKLRE